jgi:hypothetical protein
LFNFVLFNVYYFLVHSLNSGGVRVKHDLIGCLYMFSVTSSIAIARLAMSVHIIFTAHLNIPLQHRILSNHELWSLVKACPIATFRFALTIFRNRSRFNTVFTFSNIQFWAVSGSFVLCPDLFYVLSVSWINVRNGSRRVFVISFNLWLLQGTRCVLLHHYRSLIKN